MMLTVVWLGFLVGVAQATYLEREALDDEVHFDKSEYKSESEDEKSLWGYLPRDCSTGSSCDIAGGNCYSHKSQTRGCDYIKEGLCNHDHCLCCIVCGKNDYHSDCVKNGGTCRKSNDDCECPRYEEYQTLHQCNTSGCSCCRKCDTPRECTNGMCVREYLPFVMFQNYTVNKSIRCPQEECTCIQKQGCQDEGSCERVNGKCLPKYDQDYCEKKGYAVFKCGCGEDCICCVQPWFMIK